jgi:uncharacterized protein (DUF2147 family)
MIRVCTSLTLAKTVRLLATIFFGVLVTNAAQAQSLLDEWWTPGFAARVKLAACDDKLCGDIVWAWDDTPTGASDKRPLVGQRIIRGMVTETAGGASAGTVTGPSVIASVQGSARSHGTYVRYAGSIYNPEDGQTYKATMRLKTANTLLVEGCVLFICREQIWRRHDSLKSPPVSAP